MKFNNVQTHNDQRYSTNANITKTFLGFTHTRIKLNIIHLNPKGQKMSDEHQNMLELKTPKNVKIYYIVRVLYFQNNPLENFFYPDLLYHNHEQTSWIIPKWKQPFASHHYDLFNFYCNYHYCCLSVMEDMEKFELYFLKLPLNALTSNYV